MDAVLDLFPSRVSDKPSISARKDPVVYGDKAGQSDSILSKEQLASFEKNGYLFLERFFLEDEIQEYREELNRLWRECSDSDAPVVIREPTNQEVRSIFAVHQNNEVFQRLSRDPRIVKAVTQLLGSQVYIHQSRVNFKPGFNGKEFYWHSDFETWHVEDGMPRMRAVSCSIALSENNLYNGPLMVVPGSHKYYVSCVGKTPDDHYKSSLRKQEYGVPDSESLTWLIERGGIEMPVGAAGSILLFDCNVMHGSSSNISPFPRSNVFFVYNSVENALVTPFSGQKPRPEFVASRNVVPIESAWDEVKAI